MSKWDPTVHAAVRNHLLNLSNISCNHLPDCRTVVIMLDLALPDDWHWMYPWHEPSRSAKKVLVQKRQCRLNLHWGIWVAIQWKVVHQAFGLTEKPVLFVSTLFWIRRLGSTEFQFVFAIYSDLYTLQRAYLSEWLPSSKLSSEAASFFYLLSPRTAVALLLVWMWFDRQVPAV